MCVPNFSSAATGCISRKMDSAVELLFAFKCGCQMHSVSAEIATQTVMRYLKRVKLPHADELSFRAGHDIGVCKGNSGETHFAMNKTEIPYQS
jgi:hypothetical protein